MEEKRIEFISKGGNHYEVIAENNVISLVNPYNQVIEHEIIWHDKTDVQNLNDFINNCVDGIRLDNDQENQLIKFVSEYYNISINAF